MWPSRSTSEPNQALVASLHQKSSALNAALEGQKAMRHRLASVFLSASIRARQHARLARALGRWGGQTHAHTQVRKIITPPPDFQEEADPDASIKTGPPCPIDLRWKYQPRLFGFSLVAWLSGLP